MDSQRWHRARALFEAAVERPAGEQAAWLAANCGGDAELQGEVASLLAADRGDSTLGMALERGASLPPSERGALVGTRVGPFLVQRVLGAGGMGTVYAAEQDQPRRQVALKVLSLGLRSPAAVRRFQWEAEVLARLRHPGIAQVYAVGVHGDAGLDLPWFAMELVPGARDLLQHAGQERLDVAARLRLLLQVCDAVHHGHLQGVVHRDLKPANLLVDETGRVKVIDFGIARCSDADQDQGVRTASGLVLGTLHYMSPEQLGGGAVDLRADVYALGVVAFQLLSGRLPHDLQGLPPLLAARRLLEQEPMRLRQARADLDSDLAAVLDMALQREPERRYPSVAALAADLAAVLASRPVQARPPSTFYQVRKFARRHRALVVGGVGALLLLLTGLVVVSLQNVRIAAARDRAERERGRAERVSRFARGILAESDMMRARGTDYTVREALDEAALGIADEPWDDPLAEADIADLLGDTYRGLSLPEQAEPLLLRALQLRREQLGADDRATLQTELALCLLRRDQDRGAEVLAQLEDLRRRTIARFGTDDPLALSAGHNVALLWRDAGRLDEAEALYREVLTLRQRVRGEHHPDTLTTMHTLGTLLLAQNRPAEARDVLAECLARRRARGAADDHPVFWQVSDNLGEALRDLGELDAAELRHREAMAGLERLLGPDHATTIGAGYHLLKARYARGDFAGVAELSRELLVRAERTFGRDHGHTMDLRNALGSALLSGGDPAGAATEFTRAWQTLRERSGPDHPAVFTSASNLAAAHLAAGDGAAALAVTATMVERIEAGSDLRDVTAGVALLLHGRALLALDRAADATQPLRAARQRLGAALPAGHHLPAQATEALAAALTASGRGDEAAALRAQHDAGGAPR